jgi:Flp pilus assembly protein TadG
MSLGPTMANLTARRRRLMERFGADRSGALLPIFALCVTLALGTAALAVDYGRWQSERTTLAQTADAAALFGATALAEALAAGQNGEAAARAHTAALDAVKAKLGDEASPTITVVPWYGIIAQAEPADAFQRDPAAGCDHQRRVRGVRRQRNGRLRYRARARSGQRH